jgi:hypothetical protein
MAKGGQPEKNRSQTSAEQPNYESVHREYIYRQAHAAMKTTISEPDSVSEKLQSPHFGTLMPFWVRETIPLASALP